MIIRKPRWDCDDVHDHQLCEEKQALVQGLHNLQEMDYLCRCGRMLIYPNALGGRCVYQILEMLIERILA